MSLPSYYPAIGSTKGIEAQNLRQSRMEDVPGFSVIRDEILGPQGLYGAENPFLDPSERSATTDGTTYGLESHRILTPYLQAIVSNPDTRDIFLNGIDQRFNQTTVRVSDFAKSRSRDKILGTAEFDFIIVGAGSYAVQAATDIRAVNPRDSILMITEDPKIGGQPRRHGPEAAYWMNSRVRKADRRLPPIPRTPGNINPLGDFVPLEFSDVVRGNYATNAEWGMINAINGALSVSSAMVSTRCTEVRDRQNGRDASVQVTSEFIGDDPITIVAKKGVVTAIGLKQNSTVDVIKVGKNNDWYLNRDDFYAHFGNAENTPNHEPLKMFHNKTIVTGGAGDSVLTALEALVGNLPADTYGKYGPGRYRPKAIYWIGAPGSTASEIDACLRSRYKNGIIQALPKYEGDAGAIIIPVPGRVLAASKSTGGNCKVNYQANGGFGLEVEADFFFDGTNRQLNGGGRYPTIGSILANNDVRTKVIENGPGANEALPEGTLEIIRRLDVGENTAALWALMPLAQKRVARLLLEEEPRSRRERLEIGQNQISDLLGRAAVGANKRELDEFI